MVDVGGTVFPEAGNVVMERFTEAQEYADNILASTEEYLDRLLNTDINFNLPHITLSYDFPDLILDTIPTAPTPPSTDTTLPDTVQKPTLGSVTIDPVDVPSFLAIEPVLTLPQVPDVDWPADPGDPPNADAIDYPAKPDYDLPTVPVFDDLIIPSPPDISIPEFEGVYPDTDLVPPGSVFIYNEAIYESALATALDAKLLEDIQNGGTGLGADIEDAIWTRARARKDLENERVYTEAEDYFSARGWTIPPGALSGRLQEALNEQARATEQINYEISIEQAKLAYTYTIEVIRDSIQREKDLLGYSDSVATRAFTAAKFTQEAAILVFNAGVALLKLKLDAYQTAAFVYESRIKASLLVLERYKAVLEGVKVTAEVRKQLVQIYELQISAVKAIMNLYTVEMQAAAIKADVEKSKLQMYSEKVKGYTARLSAITAKFNVYGAQITGELGKVDIYKAQADAYAAVMKGVTAQSNIEIMEAEIGIKSNDQIIEQYKSEILAYQAGIDAVVKDLEIKGLIFRQQVDVYEANVKALEVEAGAKIGAYSAKSAHETNVVRVALEEMKENLKAAMAEVELSQDAAKSAAALTAQILASSLSTINASAQLGFSGSESHAYDETKDVHEYRHTIQSSE